MYICCERWNKHAHIQNIIINTRESNNTQAPCKYATKRQFIFNVYNLFVVSYLTTASHHNHHHHHIQQRNL